MFSLIRTPALIVVDMQNDFVRAGAPMEVPAARAILPALAELLAGFREAGLPVVHTRYVASDRYGRLAPRLRWLALTAPPVRACVRGVRRAYADCAEAREGVDIVGELAPRAGEAVIDKPFYSAFHATDLAARLAAAGADGVVVTGTLTEMCVEDTARHAVHFGYPTVLVSDAVASNDAAAHAATLAAFARNYGHVATAREVADSFCRDGPRAAHG